MPKYAASARENETASFLEKGSCRGKKKCVRGKCVGRTRTFAFALKAKLSTLSEHTVRFLEGGNEKKSFKLELGFMRGLSDSGGGGGTKKVSADHRPGSCVRISFFIFAFLRTSQTTPEHCLSVGNERYE